MAAAKAGYGLLKKFSSSGLVYFKIDGVFRVMLFIFFYSAHMRLVDVWWYRGVRKKTPVQLEFPVEQLVYMTGCWRMFTKIRSSRSPILKNFSGRIDKRE